VRWPCLPSWFVVGHKALPSLEVANWFTCHPSSQSSLQPASQNNGRFLIQSHGMVLLLLLLPLFCHYRFVPGAHRWSAVGHPNCVYGGQRGPD